MLMENIRRGRKKYRKLLIVVIALLVISLLSTFALLGSSAGLNAGGEGQQTELQIQALKEAIAQAEAQTGEKDYTANNTLASYYSNLASAYAEQGEDALVQEAAAKAAQYFRATAETAPEEMNELGRAQIYTNMGNHYYVAGDDVMARAAFEEAIGLAPAEWSIARAYSFFLFNTQGIEGAVAYLEEFKALAGDNPEVAAEVQGSIDAFLALQSAMENSGAGEEAPQEEAPQEEE